MVYLHEAHADDIWPMGYGITNPKNIPERWDRFDKLMKRFPKLETFIEHRFCDDMNNTFNSKTGAWPESYYFADASGNALYGTSHFENDRDMTIFKSLRDYASTIVDDCQVEQTTAASSTQ